jgi:hypothetical protein
MRQRRTQWMFLQDPASLEAKRACVRNLKNSKLLVWIYWP